MNNNNLSESIESIKNEILEQNDNYFNNFNQYSIVNTSNLNFNYDSSETKNNQTNNNQTNNIFNINEQIYESWTDINLFIPVAITLADKFQKLNLSSSTTSYLSLIFSFLSLYYFNNDNRIYATILYLTSYLLICIAKNNIITKYDMALNQVSENLINIIIITYLFKRYSYENYYVIILIIIFYMNIIKNSLNQSLISYKKFENDNFYDKLVNDYKNESNIIIDSYLLINKVYYFSYKTFFPVYNESKISNWLHMLKYFSSGNYSLLVSAILLYIE